MPDACPNLLVPGWAWDWGWLPWAGQGIVRVRLPSMGRIQSFPLEFGALETQHKEHRLKLNPQNSYLFTCLYVCIYGAVSILV